MKFNDVLKEIAKEKGISVSQVKKDMQKALDDAHKNINQHAKNGKPPSLKEFIITMMANIEADMPHQSKDSTIYH